MKNRLTQFHSSSSCHSLSQNIPFYQSTITPLKPYLGKGICKISHSIALYNSAKIRTESGKTKRLYKTNRNCCCCGFFFCSFFKQQVSEHTRLFSDCHKEHFNGFSTALSWLEIIPRIRCIYLQLPILRRDNIELFQFKLNVLSIRLTSW